MNEEISKKFGPKFMDSLLFVADRLWVQKHPDEIYENNGSGPSWDTPALFPGDNSYVQTNPALQAEFDKLVKYPKGYKKRINKNATVGLVLHVYVDEKGVAEILNFEFGSYSDETKEDVYNKKYWSYFKSVAKKLVENTIWTPAKIKDVSVKSRNGILIELE
jgi:hypothetical protein